MPSGVPVDARAEQNAMSGQYVDRRQCWKGGGGTISVGRIKGLVRLRKLARERFPKSGIWTLGFFGACRTSSECMLVVVASCVGCVGDVVLLIPAGKKELHA